MDLATRPLVRLARTKCTLQRTECRNAYMRTDTHVLLITTFRDRRTLVRGPRQAGLRVYWSVESTCVHSMERILYVHVRCIYMRNSVLVPVLYVMCGHITVLWAEAGAPTCILTFVVLLIARGWLQRGRGPAARSGGLLIARVGSGIWCHWNSSRCGISRQREGAHACNVHLEKGLERNPTYGYRVLVCTRTFRTIEYPLFLLGTSTRQVPPAGTTTIMDWI